jgi:hypothetical protein
MGTITKNYIPVIIILFEIEKNYNEERMSVLSSLETSSSPASPSSCLEPYGFWLGVLCSLSCQIPKVDGISRVIAGCHIS